MFIGPRRVACIGLLSLGKLGWVGLGNVVVCGNLVDVSSYCVVSGICATWPIVRVEQIDMEGRFVGWCTME